MKFILILVLLLIVGSIIFIFGNSLRCVSAKGGCPGMCKTITIDCSNRFDERCLEGKGNVCQGLSVNEYVEYIKTNVLKK